MPAEISPCGILVVEDNKQIRWILQRVFLQAGLVVWDVASGEDAVRLIRQHAINICLVLLDVRLGGMDGIQTALELRSLRPDVALCFMTGDPDSPAMAEAIARSPTYVFEKPFHMTQMLQEVKRILPSHCDLQAGMPTAPEQPDCQQARA